MMQSTLERVVNDRFADTPMDVALERPVVLTTDATPVTATPVAAAFVVRAIQFTVVAYVTRYLPK